jgi:hypothetical protein
VWGARLLRDAPAGASELFWALVLLPASASMSIVVIRRRVVRDGPRRALSLIVGGIGLIVAAAAVRLEWLAASPAPASEALLFWRLGLVPIPLACLALWLWGVWVGHGTIGPRDVRLAVSRNVMSIVLLYFFYNSAPVLEQNESLGPLVAVFVFGVLALAASNLERLRVQREGKAMTPVLDRYWLQTVAGLVALLLLTGVLLTGLAGTRAFAQFGTVVLIALGAIAIGVSWLVALGRSSSHFICARCSKRFVTPTLPPLPTPRTRHRATPHCPPRPFGCPRIFEIAVGGGGASHHHPYDLLVSLRSSALAHQSAEDVRESIFSSELLLVTAICSAGAARRSALSAYLRSAVWPMRPVRAFAVPTSARCSGPSSMAACVRPPKRRASSPARCIRWRPIRLPATS